MGALCLVGCCTCAGFVAGSLDVDEEKRSAPEFLSEVELQKSPLCSAAALGHAGREPCIGMFGSLGVSMRPVRASRFGRSVFGPTGSLDLDEEKRSRANLPLEVGAANILPLQRYCSTARRLADAPVANTSRAPKIDFALKEGGGFLQQVSLVLGDLFLCNKSSPAVPAAPQTEQLGWIFLKEEVL